MSVPPTMKFKRYTPLLYIISMTTYIAERTSLQVQPPPWQYLEYASIASLQSFELNRLNHAANLMKQIQCLLRQYFDDTSAASIARMFQHQPAERYPSDSRSNKLLRRMDPVLPVSIARATLA